MKGALIKRVLLSTGIVLLFLWHALAISATNTKAALFRVESSGGAANINITLCLNANGPLSCQNFDVPELIMRISTTINRVYPYAGIKINTPGYALNCTPNAFGFCLIQLSGIPTTVSVQATFPQSTVSFVVASAPDYIVGFSADFLTPDTFKDNLPSGPFSVFIWPGLEPRVGRNCFDPINLGVLQPVLSYGNSCAPFKPHDTQRWWISGQYVNGILKCDSVPSGFDSACSDYSGCHGGQFINLTPGQKIVTSMIYDENTAEWLQTIDAAGQTKTYSIALNYCSANSDRNTPVTRNPQPQTRAILSVETHGYNNPLTQTFENILIQVHVSSGAATCENTLFTTQIISSSTCTPVRTISNTGTVLTCAVDRCIIDKPSG